MTMVQEHGLVRYKTYVLEDVGVMYAENDEAMQTFDGILVRHGFMVTGLSREHGVEISTSWLRTH
jgi:hypothetical protein